MRIDGLGDHLDVHAGERFRGIDEPLHFGFLGAAIERRQILDFGIEEGLGFVHSGISLACSPKQHKRGRRC
jgi:hypothetical protein